MTVPVVPFYASQALAEYPGSGPLVSSLIGRPNAPGGSPFYLSALAGASNVVTGITPGDQLGGVGATTHDFNEVVSYNVAPSSFTWSLNTDAGAATIIAGQGTDTVTVRLNAGGGYAHTQLTCDMVILGQHYYQTATLDWQH